MQNKLIAICVAAFSLFIAIPSSSAASDIPLLSWERGKEQNIVLGGYTNQSTWNIQLVADGQEPMMFSKSTANKDGYFVYSIFLPQDFPTGAYRVESLGKTGDVTVVAGVQVVELMYFDIIRVPYQLLFLLTVLIFLISTLSTLRLRRYEQMSYLQSKSEVHLAPAIASFYRLRSNSVAGVQRSLFKHVIKKEGELLHKISPSLWALVPVVTFVFGSYIGITAGSELGIPSIPIILFVIAAIIGVFDPYSGFTAALGFSILQTMQGQISSMRAVGALMAIALAWLAPGLIASIYREMIAKDSLPKAIIRTLPTIFASFFGAAIFFSSELLLSSLLDRAGPIVNSRIDLPIAVGVAVFLKERLEILVDRRSLLSDANIEVKSIRLSRIISPRAMGILALFFAGVSYVWTESLVFSSVTAVVFTIPLLLLQVRFASPVIRALAKVPRNFLVESTIVSAISFGIFTYVQSTPFEVIQKGKLIILGAAVPLMIHAILSSLSDTQDRELVDAL
jgi:hypothetical protein